ncbi:ZIP family metal transporter [Casimicrobium huifangae]|uniref:ZIP family metal transporter n=1 Tax=Casimicrobium huifangae TaxID=2591109 RepID=UPI0012EB1687|nr:transporter [Casimicrobium huifangae]
MPLLNVLSYAAIPVVAVVAGGILSSLRPPGAAMRSAVQHFAAGVVFAALATELLPEVMHRRLPLQTIGGFALGVVVMLLLKAFTEKKSEGADTVTTGLPTTLLIALGVDIALDGLLIGVGFAAGEKQGLLLTIALTLEVLFLGVSASAALSGGGATRPMIALITAGLGGLLLLGAGLGAVVLSGASSSTIDVVLSFGIAALLYLVVEELMVEAHEGPESPWLCATFFVGFLVLLIVEMFI